MHKIDTLNAVVGAPAPKTPGTPGWFDTGDPNIPRDATHLDQDWCNAVQGELTAAIEAAGLALDKTNTEQLLAAWPILTRDKLHGFRADPQSPASMSVDVGLGSFYDGPTGALIVKGTQFPPAFVAPTTNPRNDIIHIDARTGVVGVTAGTEAASPVDPVLTFDTLPVARVNLTVGMTEITAAEIDDIRYFGALGTRDFQVLGPTVLSGAAVGFTGIRAGARRITVYIKDVSLTGTNEYLMRLGAGGSYEATGYVGNGYRDASPAYAWSTSIRMTSATVAGNVYQIRAALEHFGPNIWSCQGHGTAGGIHYHFVGHKPLSAELDRLQILPSGANTFDNGTITALVE